MINRRHLLGALPLAATSVMAWGQDAAPQLLTSEQLRDAVKAQLPPPPEGFTWQVYKNAVFPKPAEWTERELPPTKGPVVMSAYAMSPENFSAQRPFETGFSVQIITGPKRRMNLEARTMAMATIRPILSSHRKDEILILDQKSGGDFQQTFLRYRDAPPGLKPIIVHRFMPANEKTDTVHVFIFESPEDRWDENWARFGTPILQRVNVVVQASAE